MTVKEEISLRLSGVTSAEIKDLKEREKLEKETGEVETENEAEENEAENKAEEKEAENKAEAEDEVKNKAKDTEKEKEIEELKAQILKLQNDKSHADFSDNIDSRSDFDKCVDIFKNAY